MHTLVFHSTLERELPQGCITYQQICDKEESWIQDKKEENQRKGEKKKEKSKTLMSVYQSSPKCIHNIELEVLNSFHFNLLALILKKMDWHIGIL